ncbi:MAG: hypothetical protein ABH983_04760 [Candidatus Micrarchaeota archaeon]
MGGQETTVRRAVAASPAVSRKPTHSLFPGKLTVVTSAFTSIYQGSRTSDSAERKTVAKDLYSKAQSFAAHGVLNSSLEGVILNGADPTNLFSEIVSLHREAGDNVALDALMDSCLELSKSSNAVTRGTAVNLTKTLLRGASQRACAILADQCIELLTDPSKSVQSGAADILAQAYRYLDQNGRQFVRDSVEHIGQYGVLPDAHDPNPNGFSKETATALLGNLVVPKVIDLKETSPGVYSL